MSRSSNDGVKKTTSDRHSDTRTDAQVVPLDTAAVENVVREVVTRLHRRRVAEAAHADVPSATELERFCQLLTGADDHGAAHFVEQLIQRGIGLNAIYLNYIAAAAVRLGRRWDNDTSTFVEMTVASGRLYAIMRTIRRSIATPATHSTRHAFFCAVPGEQHTLGVTMAADMFRQRGWQIDTAVNAEHDELVEQIGQSGHTFIGLSASRPSMALPLAHLIVDVRLSKPEAFIMVAGAITELVPDLRSIVDADIVAGDADSAVVEMEKIRRELESRATRT